jgi:MerR family transcriptional regulator, thiopeptide resistance regulator
MQKKTAAKERTTAAVQGEKSHTISKLGRLFGLSRSALLYYDRIGLLKPSGRTRSGYRCYSGADRRRLERICGFRRAGLALEEIRSILASEGKPSAAILERRFHEIGEEIRILKAKQGLLSRMLMGMTSAKFPSTVDRDLWVKMLRAAGMDEKAMARWHAEFEQRAPEAHREFLLSLGIPEEETLEIRKWSRLTSANSAE